MKTEIGDAAPATQIHIPAPVEAPKAGVQIAPKSIRSIITKLSQVMGELDWIEKRGHNSFFNYDYAMESDILDAIRSKLAVRQVFVQTLIKSVDTMDTGKTSGRSNEKVFRTIVHTAHIFHDGETGEMLEINGYGVGEDTADKGAYKAMTGAMKYAMSKNFLISSGDDPELEEDEEDGKKKTKGAAQQGVKRTSEAPQAPAPTPDEEILEPIIDASQKSGGVGKNAWVRYGIRFQKAGWVNTTSQNAMELAKKLKGTGIVCKAKLIRDSGWVNLGSLAERLPDGKFSEVDFGQP